MNSYDVDISVSDSLGEIYNYQFIPIDDRYYLDIGLLDGKYNFVASTKINDEILTKKGEILISDFNLESRDEINQELSFTEWTRK